MSEIMQFAWDDDEDFFAADENLAAEMAFWPLTEAATESFDDEPEPDDEVAEELRYAVLLRQLDEFEAAWAHQAEELFEAVDERGGTG